jgi:hypothetical protein
MAKRDRERKLLERRQEKAARKAARKLAAEDEAPPEFGPPAQAVDDFGPTLRPAEQEDPPAQ